ncbi:Dual specificity protein phosphatase 3 [Pseudolycoriella hygida]|uniref:Dual specificity protein phosphatase 3 n=1 Tax=Pseudolycoriella hygida TaxID=35572 RepID=A0A9Q0MM62_9DIPT|nr:Dual specificity protein phosphatase 3 [Pseudolycoriella hygida]
MSKIQQKKPRK